MTTLHKGSCSCGVIKIEISADPLFVGLCHCKNCHKATSSAFSTNWVTPRPAFKVVEGDPTVYTAIGGSGNPANRAFCNKCSSVMWTESPTRPELVFVKAGIMDDGAFDKFKPGSEMFTSRKVNWLGDCQIEGAMQLPEGFPANAAPTLEKKD